MARDSIPERRTGLRVSRVAWILACTCLLSAGLPAGAAGGAKPPRIVFCSNRSGEWRIWTIGSDGQGLKQLAEAEKGSHDTDPVFSADGASLLFTSTRGGTEGVWRMPAGGGKATRICDGRQAEWSPDGKRIVFSRGKRILIRTLADDTERVLTPEQWLPCDSPSWSPDGKTIAFAVRRKGAEGRKDARALYVVPAGGGKPRKVYDEEGACEPHWSPDGKMLIYETEKHLALIGPDGTDNRLVTWFGGIQRYGRFSPDGKQIAFCQGSSPKGPWELYLIPATGGNPRRLTRKGSDMHPDWQRPATKPVKVTHEK